MNLASVSKAIAGAIVAALVSYLTARGIIINQEVGEAVSVLIAALIGFVGVYISPRNRDV